MIHLKLQVAVSQASLRDQWLEIEWFHRQWQTSNAIKGLLR